MSGSIRGFTMRDLSVALGRLLRRQPLGAAGGLIVLVLIAVALLAPRLAPHGPKDAAFAPYLPPSAEFPMGTDQVGRDVMSRVIWGARLSLYVGLVSVVVTAVVVAVAGAGLLRVLERRTPEARRVWTGVAMAVWVVSLVGPASARTVQAALTLAALHLVVGAVVIVGLRRRHADRPTKRATSRATNRVA